MLKRFIFSNNRTIVATSLLGLGVNIPNIDIVLHLEALRLVKNYT